MNSGLKKSSKSGFFCTLFLTSLFLHACAAYSLGPIPLQWIGQSILVVVFSWILLRRETSSFPGTLPLLMFSFWSFLVTLFNMGIVDYSSFLPPLATTPYYAYISLRVFTLICFLSSIAVTHWLFKNNEGDRIIDGISKLGLIFSIYALYVYVAQIKGWPEIPRTRVGTTGHDQITVFTYAFHRAMGSFREPSHLAEWLILPLFLNLSKNKIINKISLLTISSALLLSGSLTGIISGVAGLGVSIFLNMRRLLPESKKSLKVIVPIIIAGFVFSIFVSRNESGNTDLIEVIWNRVEPMLSEKGAEASNRDYVYKYIKGKPVPIVGVGLGHSNIMFSYESKLDATASFLNMYLNILYSLGLIGIILLIWILVYPFLLVISNLKTSKRPGTFFLTSAYVAWLIIFMVHSEELSIHFGVIYAMSIYLFSRAKSLKDLS